MVTNLNDMADDLRDHVFQLLDSEEGFPGDCAGAVAAAVEAAFRDALLSHGFDVRLSGDARAHCPGCSGFAEGGN